MFLAILIGIAWLTLGWWCVRRKLSKITPSERHWLGSLPQWLVIVSFAMALPLAPVGCAVKLLRGEAI